MGALPHPPQPIMQRGKKARGCLWSPCLLAGGAAYGHRY